MSFDKIFDLTAGVWFYYYNSLYSGVYFKRNNRTPPIEKKLTHMVYYNYQQRSS